MISCQDSENNEKLFLTNQRWCQYCLCKHCDQEIYSLLYPDHELYSILAEDVGGDIDALIGVEQVTGRTRAYWLEKTSDDLLAHWSEQKKSEDWLDLLIHYIVKMMKPIYCWICQWRHQEHLLQMNTRLRMPDKKISDFFHSFLTLQKVL